MPSALSTLPGSATPQARYARLDALRGLAMVWMTVFHLCFDLQHFGYLQADFYQDPFWTWQRVCIVSLFCGCAGVGQAIARGQGQSAARFWLRWRQVAAGALLVTAGSYLMYPQSFIYFGILHGIACMLIVLRFFAPSGAWLWFWGALAMALPQVAPAAHAAWPTLEWLNTPAGNWLGFVGRKPVTEDYAPLLPWLGPMLWGMAMGQWLQHAHGAWLSRPLGGLGRALALLGRWSLSYYLLHQPVLIGLLMLAGAAAT